jgi:hypothetical protein
LSGVGWGATVVAAELAALLRVAATFLEATGTLGQPLELWRGMLDSERREGAQRLGRCLYLCPDGVRDLVRDLAVAHEAACDVATGALRELHPGLELRRAASLLATPRERLEAALRLLAATRNER